jgi:hypothetical protein
MKSNPLPPLFRAIGRSVLAIELPFLTAMLLVQVFVRCPDCRATWREYWPIMAGFAPSYLWGFRPGGWQFVATIGLVTGALVAGVFLLNRRWKHALALGGIVATLLAILSHAIIAA